jgi:very-short-patch-repair endonuclease
MRDPRLITHAKQMRREMTEPEIRIWLKLRAKRFCEVKFRKQKVVGNYIVDFCSNEPKLAIEIDGDAHAGRDEYDAIRSRFLEEQGYRVVRFSNRDVMTNLDGVLESLAAIIDEMTAPLLPPLRGSLLSPEGERALGSSLSPLQGRDARLGSLLPSRSRERQA